MAEKSDIDDFFAKKASKSKKKSNVMNVGEIAQKLERSAIIHERREQREASEANNENLVENGEDSEWIDPTAGESETNFEELGIKDMAASVELSEEEEEEAKVEPVKTWNTAKSGSVTAEAGAPKPENKGVAPQQKYRAPLGKFRAAGPKIDITSNEMFPTLAAADVKVKEEKIKAAEVKTEKSDGWHTQGAKNAASVPKAPDSIFNKSTANAYKPPSARGEGNAGAIHTPSKPREPVTSKPLIEDTKQEEKKPEKSAYKPPAARGENSVAPHPAEFVAASKPPTEESTPEEKKPAKYVPPQRR